LNSILIVGIIIAAGFLFGELAQAVKLPKVTGYIIAGIALNPTLTGIIPEDFVRHTSLTTSIALSFITFSVGGALSIQRLRELGRSILLITIFEAETAFILVTIGFCVLLRFFPLIGNGAWLSMAVPFSLLLGSLASPTDPSATLAVVHEYNAKGKVSTTILGVAGFDDILGILNFTIASTIAGVLIGASRIDFAGVALKTAWSIGGAALIGSICAFALMLAISAIKRETEGAHIVLVLAGLCLCYGLAVLTGADELLSTMIMGAVIVNFSKDQEGIFKLLERYTDELIFVLFFTISGMHLDFSVITGVIVLFIIFAGLRFSGKVGGTLIGTRIDGLSLANGFRISLGLIPQGGIVIGLALSLMTRPEFAVFSRKFIAIIIGATVIHEIIGPLFAVRALSSAGELGSDSKDT